MSDLTEAEIERRIRALRSDDEQAWRARLPDLLVAPSWPAELWPVERACYRPRVLRAATDAEIAEREPQP